jgi:hypothetical protein
MAVRHGNIAVAAIRLPLHIAGGTPREPIGSDLLQLDVHGWRGTPGNFWAAGASDQEDGSDPQ